VLPATFEQCAFEQEHGLFSRVLDLQRTDRRLVTLGNFDFGTAKFGLIAARLDRRSCPDREPLQIGIASWSPCLQPNFDYLRSS
jgi:hypothetical protein